MRKFPKQQFKVAIACMAIGVAVFGLIAYGMLLFSVTQSVAQKGQPAAITAR